MKKGKSRHRDDIVLAGKTGTAEIKASKDDTSGTELGWFAVFTAEETVERPILIISMVQPFEDGTFRYLSNSMEQIELELPPIAKAH